MRSGLAFPRLRSLAFGATLPLEAARLILARPRLFFWSALPIALTLGLYFLLIRNLTEISNAWLVSHFLSWGWNPTGFFAGVLTVLARIALFLLGAVTFSVGATLVASPFNDFLAETAEPWTAPPLPPAPRTGALAKVKLLLIDGFKAVCALGAGLLALLLSWVPGLNIAAFLLVCLLVTFQYVSYPQTRRGEGLWRGLGFLFRYPFAAVGFGAALSFLFAIPIVSCFAVPLAVVGGTVLYARARPEAGTFRLH